MTPIAAVEALAGFIRGVIKDTILPARNKSGEAERRCPHVYAMSLPDQEASTKNIPYILLQLVTGTSEQSGQTCSVRLVIAVYDQNMADGNYALTELITRIMTALRKETVIDGKYMVDQEKPIEYLTYTDNVAPYFIGEMMIHMQLPPIWREVKSNWKGDRF